eukprot:125660-Rhodomonas_salina.7
MPISLRASLLCLSPYETPMHISLRDSCVISGTDIAHVLLCDALYSHCARDYISLCACYALSGTDRAAMLLPDGTATVWRLVECPGRLYQTPL